MICTIYIYVIGRWLRREAESLHLSGTGDSSSELLPVRSIKFQYTLYYVITHTVIIVLEYIILKNVYIGISKSLTV